MAVSETDAAACMKQKIEHLVRASNAQSLPAHSRGTNQHNTNASSRDLDTRAADGQRLSSSKTRLQAGLRHTLRLFTMNAQWLAVGSSGLRRRRKGGSYETRINPATEPSYLPL